MRTTFAPPLVLALLVTWLFTAVAPGPAAAARTDEEKLERLVERGRKDLSEERYEKAVKRFIEADELTGGVSAEVLAGLADAYLGLSEYQAAIDTADRLLEIAADNRQRAKGHNVIGLAFFGRGEVGTADRTHIPLPDRSEDQEQIFGRLQEEWRDHQDAIEQEYLAAADAFRRVLELTDAKYAASWMNYAEALFRGGQHDAARRALDQLEARLPEGEDLPQQAAGLRSCLDLLASSDLSPVYLLGEVVDGAKIGPPEPLFKVQPMYTTQAREARLQGVVLVKGIINQEGRFVCPRVLQGLPLGLTEATLEALREWKFKPPTLDGKPVNVHFWLTTDFRLQ